MHISVVLVVTPTSANRSWQFGTREMSIVVLGVVCTVALVHFPGVLRADGAGLADVSVAVASGEGAVAVHLAATVALGVVGVGAGEGDAGALGADGAATAE